MAISEERIKALMEKDIKSKTVLVPLSEKEKVIKDHFAEGWTLVKQSEVNNKIKITFQIVK